MAQIPVQLLLKTLGNFLVSEIRLQGSVRPELKQIMLELQNMRSLLKDADSKLLTDEHRSRSKNGLNRCGRQPMI
ncbi:hypothetical protein EJ110_NYTH40455 [Nymphaea thermarum]|nr:hypothetical protein EJ110_NYTH40455 [Nymphaea thermarum]